eukprot:gene21089-27976_t
MSSYALRHLRELRNIKLDGLRFRLVDAQGQVVGPLAQQIAIMLQGKDKPTFNPKKNEGDVVIVINASRVHLTHDRWDTKLYRYHTGYPGGLREQTAAELWEKEPCKLLRGAVKGMLPKNKLQVFRLDKLKLFPEAEHPFGDLDLVPFVMRPKQIRAPGLSWPIPAGFKPLNPDRYSFRVKADPSLLTQQRPSVDMKNVLTEQEMQRLQQGLQCSRGPATAIVSDGSSMFSHVC